MSVEKVAGRVSVVVASYNHAKYLARRMESLVSQTYRDLEILVIDDRSPDDSVDILRAYESDPRVRLIVRETNAGWVAVCNQGLEMATGEFVLFANCDDDCAPDMIETLVGSIRSHPSAAIAYCRSLLIDGSGRSLGDDFSIRERRFRKRCAASTLLSGSEMTRFLLYSCVIPNLSCALFRTACLREVGGFSNRYRVCSDWELFFRIVSRYDVYYAAAPMNFFRQHEASVRSSTREREVNAEYIRLLLTQRRKVRLTWSQTALIRIRTMSMWSASLISRSSYGLRNCPYYVGLVFRHDAPALLYVLPAVALRAAGLAHAFLAGGVARAVGAFAQR